MSREVGHSGESPWVWCSDWLSTGLEPISEGVGEVVVAAKSAYKGGDLGRPDAEVAGGGCEGGLPGLA
jgi:hypothetical protein